MPELVLSPSSVASYQSCGYRWYLQYVEMIEGVTSVKSAVGVGVHTGGEHWLKAAIAGEVIDEADLLTESIEAAELAYIFELSNVAEEDEDPVKMREVVGRVLTAYIEDVALPLLPHLLGAEQPFRIVVDGVEFSGHIDVDQDGAVRDTKVLGQKPRYPEKYLFSLTGYAMGSEVMHGVPAHRILDVMIRLKRDRPRHEPIDFGDVTQRDRDTFSRTLVSVANQITKGVFDPTGLATGECRYCPVRFECEYNLGINVEGIKS